MKEIEGCAHLYMKDGKPTRLVTHLSDIPKDGVVHLKAGRIYSDDEFIQSHPQDKSELEIKENGFIISEF